MNVLITNDDGLDAPGLRAAYEAVRALGRVHVVAPKSERSACSHMITLGHPITVEELEHAHFGTAFAVDGTPADCVRLAVAELITEPIDLLLSGINRGANSGVDVYYSGTVAGAREGAILGIKSVAASQAIRNDHEVDWAAASKTVHDVLTEMLLTETLPAPGFWSLNLPQPIPEEGLQALRRVPVAVDPTPLKFERSDSADGKTTEFGYGAPYWGRDVQSPTDFSTIRDGLIALTAIPLNGKF